MKASVAMYGSAGGWGNMDPEATHSPFFIPFPMVPVPKRRLNLSAMALSVVGPCGLFAFILWVVSNYSEVQPDVTRWVVICGLGAILCFVLKAWRNNWVKRKYIEDYDPEHGPTWLLFIGTTALLAWVLALMLGSRNAAIMEAYHSFAGRSVVREVDPRTDLAQAFLDSRVLVFRNGSYIDRTRALAFRNTRNYCVAPVMWGQELPARFEFWAAGTDCCDPYGGDFWCGEARHPAANTGYRIMNNGLNGFYRMATRQAEAQYKLFAERPIFFTWSLDPDTADGQSSSTHPDRQLEKIRRNVAVACFFHFVFQLLACFGALAYYEKQEE